MAFSLLSNFIICDLTKELPLDYNITAKDLEEYVAVRKGASILTNGTLLIQDANAVRLRCPLCLHSYGILAPYLTTVASVRESRGVYEWYIDFTFGFQLIENVTNMLTEVVYERNFTIKRDQAVDLIETFLEEISMQDVLDFVLDSSHRILRRRKPHYCPLL